MHISSFALICIRNQGRLHVLTVLSTLHTHRFLCSCRRAHFGRVWLGHP